MPRLLVQVAPKQPADVRVSLYRYISMNATRLLFAMAFAAALVGVLHLCALQFFLYWRFFWFDILVHSMGGVFIALAVAWLSTRSGHSVSVALCVSVAFALGIAWEIFEYDFNIPQTLWVSYPFDTAKDIVMDTFGGTIGASLARRIASRDTIIP